MYHSTFTPTRLRLSLSQDHAHARRLVIRGDGVDTADHRLEEGGEDGLGERITRRARPPARVVGLDRILHHLHVLREEREAQRLGIGAEGGGGGLEGGLVGHLRNLLITAARRLG